MGRLGPGDLGAMGDDSALGSKGGFMGAMMGEPLALDLLWPGSTDCKQHSPHAAQSDAFVLSCCSAPLRKWAQQTCQRLHLSKN